MDRTCTSACTSACTPAADTAAPGQIDAYYQSLSEREQQGYRVATNLLGSTFDVVKTRGFLAWQKQQQQQQQPTESGKKRKEI